MNINVINIRLLQIPTIDIQNRQGAIGGHTHDIIIIRKIRLIE